MSAPKTNGAPKAAPKAASPEELRARLTALKKAVSLIEGGTSPTAAFDRALNDADVAPETIRTWVGGQLQKYSEGEAVRRAREILRDAHSILDPATAEGVLQRAIVQTVADEQAAAYELGSAFGLRIYAALCKPPSKDDAPQGEKIDPQAQVQEALAELQGGVLDGAALAKAAAPLTIVIWKYGIAQGRPTAISSYGGVGKTWLAIDLALAVASGSAECWGIDNMLVPHQGARVGHLDYEMGEQQLQLRYQRVAFARGVDLAQLRDRLRIRSFPKFNLTHPHAAAVLEAFCAGLRVCIIDSFRAAVPGVKENESDARQYLDLLTPISIKTGCVFVVLFHDGKSGKDERSRGQKMRGSSALFDALGSQLSVTNEEDDKIGDYLLVTHEKPGVTKKSDDVMLRFQDVGNTIVLGDMFYEEGFKIVALTHAEKKAAQEAARAAAQADAIKAAVTKVVDIVQGSGANGIGATALRDALKAASDVKNLAIAEAAKKGLVRVVQAGNKRTYLPVEGRTEASSPSAPEALLKQSEESKEKLSSYPRPFRAGGEIQSHPKSTDGPKLSSPPVPTAPEAAPPVQSGQAGQVAETAPAGVLGRLDGLDVAQPG